MSDATYKYTLKAKSGYKSEQSGAMTVERHAVVCQVLEGNLVDDVALLKTAPKLLELLERIVQAEYTVEGGQWPEEAELRAAIAEAKDQ
jgi:hypothetical protein